MGGKICMENKCNLTSCQRNSNSGLFFGYFQKTQGPKNSTSKKTQGHFCRKTQHFGIFVAFYKKLNSNDFNKYTFPKADGIN